MLNENTILKSIAEDFIKTAEDYRKAISESSLINKESKIMDSTEAMQKTMDHIKRLTTLHTSKDYIGITREEYWSNILKAKIEVIASIGGLSFMEDFYEYLEEHPKNNELKLTYIFSTSASGICGWGD